MYRASSWVSQICVYADPIRSYAIAVVVPSPDKVAEFAKGKGNKDSLILRLAFRYFCPLQERRT